MPLPAHVLMLLANGFEPDPRVHKEARSLVAAGVQVSILCLDRAQDRPARETYGEIAVRRIQVGAVSPGRASSVAPALVRFNLRAYLQALRVHRETRIELVHCHDLDTMPAGAALRRTLGVPLVYDLHDLYSSFLAHPATRAAVDTVDRLAYREADGLIVVNDRFLRIAGVDRSDTAVVMNVPDTQGAGPRFDTSAGLFYAGNLEPLRDMRYAIPVWKKAEIPVRLAGDGPHYDAYASLTAGTDVRLLGRIPPSEVYEWTARCLAVLALYDTARENNRLASPNKLFDAMKYGKPAIVSDGTVMADIVRQYDCGLSVPYGDAAALQAAIQELSQPQRYRRLCANAYRAFESEFNWDVMAPRLLGLYERLCRTSVRTARPID